MNRIVARTGLTLMTAAILAVAGCAPQEKTIEEQIATLPYLPEARQADFTAKLLNLPEDAADEKRNLLGWASAENDAVGRRLSQNCDNDEATPDGIELHADGTVTGQGPEYEKLSSPRYWRMGPAFVHLCWEEECPFHASYTVYADLSGEGRVRYWFFAEGIKVVSDDFAGATQDAANFCAPREEPYTSLIITDHDYVRLGFDDAGNVVDPREKRR